MNQGPRSGVNAVHDSVLGVGRGERSQVDIALTVDLGPQEVDASPKLLVGGVSARGVGVGEPNELLHVVLVVLV